MKMQMVFALVVGLAISTSALSAEPMQLSPAAAKSASVLENAALRTNSLEAFGQATVQQALQKAAESIRKGNNEEKPLHIILDFTVNRLPKRPSPEDIDVCYEICPSGRRGETFLQCYVNCAAPTVK